MVAARAVTAAAAAAAAAAATNDAHSDARGDAHVLDVTARGALEVTPRVVVSISSPAHVAAALASERARWRRRWRQRRQRQLINALLVGRGAGASSRSRLRARALDGARRRDVGALALARALGPLVVDAALPPTPRTYGGGGPPPFGAAEARAQPPLLHARAAMDDMIDMTGHERH